MRIVSFMLIASLSLAQAPTLLAQEPTATELTWTEIADRVYLLEGFWQGQVNVIAFTGPDGILLVDSGPPEEAECLRDEITKLDAGPIQFVMT